MAAYLVLMQQVDDVGRYREAYLPGLRPFLAKYGAEVLVAGFDAEPAEGEQPNSTVVIRFADTAAAWDFSTTRTTSRSRTSGSASHREDRWWSRPSSSRRGSGNEPHRGCVYAPHPRHTPW